MYRSPTKMHQREIAGKHVERLIQKPDANAALVAVIQAVFADAWKQWVDAIKVHRVARGAQDGARREIAVKDAGFDAKLRTWAGSVRDGQGRVRTAEVTNALDGITAGRLVYKTATEEVERAKRLFERVEGDPSLKGNPADFDALVAATRDLAAAVDAEQALLRRRLEAGVSLGLATDSFDDAYRKVIRAVDDLMPAAQAKGALPAWASRPDEKDAIPDATIAPVLAPADELPSEPMPGDSEPAAAADEEPVGP